MAWQFGEPDPAALLESMSSLQFAKWHVFRCRKEGRPISKQEENQVLSSKWSAFADQVRILQEKKKHGGT